MATRRSTIGNRGGIGWYRLVTTSCLDKAFFIGDIAQIKAGLAVRQATLLGMYDVDVRAGKIYFPFVQCIMKILPRHTESSTSTL